MVVLSPIVHFARSFSRNQNLISFILNSSWNANSSLFMTCCGRLRETEEERKRFILNHMTFFASSLGKANIVSGETSSAASIAFFIASLSLGALTIRTVSGGSASSRNIEVRLHVVEHFGGSDTHFRVGFFRNLPIFMKIRPTPPEK